MSPLAFKSCGFSRPHGLYTFHTFETFRPVKLLHVRVHVPRGTCFYLFPKSTHADDGANLRHGSRFMLPIDLADYSIISDPKISRVRMECLSSNQLIEVATEILRVCIATISPPQSLHEIYNDVSHLYGILHRPVSLPHRQDGLTLAQHPAEAPRTNRHDIFFPVPMLTFTVEAFSHPTQR